MSNSTVDKARLNAQQACSQLEKFLAQPVADDRDIAGIVQAFEFTFEATWKLIQKVADAQGLPAPSPKKAIKAGYQLGLCQSESIWLQMLEDRNLTSHAYNQPLAQAIYEHVRDQYAAALRQAIELSATLG